MRDVRMEIRWAADDPVAALLGNIPRGQRTKVVQAILNAALLPGGWARIVDGDLTVRNGGEDPTPKGSADSGGLEDSVSADTGMSATASRGFLASLRKFGAELDD